MRRFAPALRRISRELKLPERVKSRILLEMASDLGDLFDHYRSRGMDEEEAARRTEEKILATPEVLRHLITVHTTGYQRWVSRAAGRLVWGYDLLLFVVGVVPVLAISAYVVAARFEVLPGTPFLWPLLLIALAVVGIAMVKAYQLFVRSERSTGRLSRGLSGLAFLGVIGPVVGGIGCLIGLHSVALMASGASLDGSMQVAAMESIERAAVLMAVGLQLGIAAGLVWFVLVNRIASIEESESAAILAME